jgi:hypothetical protein
LEREKREREKREKREREEKEKTCGLVRRLCGHIGLVKHEYGVPAD